jgi:hypothetical protein
LLDSNSHFVYHWNLQSSGQASVQGLALPQIRQQSHRILTLKFHRVRNHRFYLKGFAQAVFSIAYFLFVLNLLGQMGRVRTCVGFTLNFHSLS